MEHEEINSLANTYVDSNNFPFNPLGIELAQAMEDLCDVLNKRKISAFPKDKDVKMLHRRVRQLEDLSLHIAHDTADDILQLFIDNRFRVDEICKCSVDTDEFKMNPNPDKLAAVLAERIESAIRSDCNSFNLAQYDRSKTKEIVFQLLKQAYQKSQLS